MVLTFLKNKANYGKLLENKVFGYGFFGIDEKSVQNQTYLSVNGHTFN